MPSHRKIWLKSCLAAALLLGTAPLWLRNEPSPIPPDRSDRSDRSIPPRDFAGERAGAGSVLDDALQGLGRAKQPREVDLALAQLKAELDLLPPEEASRLIQDFLQSGSDAKTGQSLAPGPGGSLQHVSSLRVFLLDQLARLDPRAAATHARTGLGALTAPDEWAMHLRNLARVASAPADLAFLRDAFQRLARHGPWQEQPTRGYLEAFDLPVFLGDPALVPDLASLLRPGDNPALSHAAFLALDRLAQQHPAETLALLEQQPALLESRPLNRASFFARADLRDSVQQTIVERYLLNPSFGAPEKAEFAALFPLASYKLSHNLLTTSQPPGAEEIMARDRAARAVVAGWLSDPRFANLHDPLRDIESRLRRFTEPAQGF